MGEYLAAPALLDEPAVQQSFLSYFNTTAVSPRQTETTETTSHCIGRA